MNKIFWPVAGLYFDLTRKSVKSHMNSCGIIYMFITGKYNFLKSIFYMKTQFTYQCIWMLFHCPLLQYDRTPEGHAAEASTPIAQAV